MSEPYFKHDQAIVAKGAKVGNGTRVWAFTNICEGAVIGQDCNICDGCFVEKGAKIGNRVTLKNNVAVFEGIYLADDVFVGANVTFINDRRPRSKQDWKCEKVYVGQGATIGAGAIVLCGITIGKYAMIGAGALVTKDVGDYECVLGAPAKRCGYVDEQGQKLDEHLVSPSGKTFQLTDAGIEPI